MTGKSIFNGHTGPWWRVGAIIFAAGICWAKVDAFQDDIRSLETRVACIERILMDKKGTD